MLLLCEYTCQIEQAIVACLCDLPFSILLLVLKWFILDSFCNLYLAYFVIFGTLVDISLGALMALFGCVPIHNHVLLICLGFELGLVVKVFDRGLLKTGLGVCKLWRLIHFIES